MGIETALVIGAIGVSAAGTAVSYSASKKQAAASEAAANAQNEANQIQLQQQAAVEAQRKQQMELDAMRQKREIIRQGLAARAQALATATAQGASRGSGLQGGYGQIEGQVGTNTLATTQNEQIGSNIFNINAAARTGLSGAYNSLSSAYGAMASAQGMGALGAGLSSLGGTVLRNVGTITKIGSFVAGGFGGGAGNSFGYTGNRNNSAGEIY